ncbi:uncharacterized protein [Palaemon carinicauda]|uniref:uncharacterized protein n=1 Tax=Palaemon carinicauda TaxID=392227 RepID=UPI0035B5FB13
MQKHVVEERTKHSISEMSSQKLLKADRAIMPRVPVSQDGFSFTPGESGRGIALNRQRGRSVGDIEELTRMEKILDEWTPYASLDHVGGVRPRGYGQAARVHQDGSGAKALNRPALRQTGHNLRHSSQSLGVNLRSFSADLQMTSAVADSRYRKKSYENHHYQNTRGRDFKPIAITDIGRMNTSKTPVEVKRDGVDHQAQTKGNTTQISRQHNSLDSQSGPMENGLHQRRKQSAFISQRDNGSLTSEETSYDNRSFQGENGFHDTGTHSFIKAWHDSEGIRWGSSRSGKLVVNEDKWIVRDVTGQFYRESFVNSHDTERKNTLWGQSSDDKKMQVDKKGRAGGVEGKITRKKEEKQRRNKENRPNWLTEDTMRKIEDYHSDEFTEKYIKGNKMLANKSTQVKFEKNPSKIMTFDKGSKNWKVEHGDNTNGEDFRFVKRGIRFWDGEKRETDCSPERTKKIGASSRKRKDEEAWDPRDEDTVWVQKADKSIRLKNLKERLHGAEKTGSAVQEKNTATKKDKVLGGTLGIQEGRGNYWRIGHGEKAMSKELQVVSTSDEQLTSF